MKKPTKQVNKVDVGLQEEPNKQLIRERMKALAELEDKLGCVFMPVTHREVYKGFETGSTNYIVPIDAPKVEEPVQTDEPVV